MTTLDLLAIAGVVTVPLSIGLAVAWRSARREAQLRAEFMMQAAMGQKRDSTDVARLERAVESIAIEVERISESQRFLSRLLVERADPRSLPSAPPRVITPH